MNSHRLVVEDRKSKQRFFIDDADASVILRQHNSVSCKSSSMIMFAANSTHIQPTSTPPSKEPTSINSSIFWPISVTSVWYMP
uniref:Uncharacterized protein n=1 Tax=Anopheles epiroticus TaxID=199890 RepID=A0A182PWY4_9DIPT